MGLSNVKEWQLKCLEGCCIPHGVLVVESGSAPCGILNGGMLDNFNLNESLSFKIKKWL